MKNLIGKTHRQMMDAPEGSIFVWWGNEIDYALSLSKAVHRQDLQIMPLSWLRAEHIMGLKTPVVLDHGIKKHNTLSINRRAIEFIIERGLMHESKDNDKDRYKAVVNTLRIHSQFCLARSSFIGYDIEDYYSTLKDIADICENTIDWYERNEEE